MRGVDRYHLMRLYGITPEQFDAMLESQGGVCAICKSIPDGKGRFSKWNVDHDHATGKVRGILCGWCNSGLGYFKDSPDSLAAAIQYLR